MILATAVAGAIRDEYADRRYAAKRMARVASCSTRTAERWMAGDATPRATELLALMADNDRLRARIEGIVAEASAVRASLRRPA